MDAREVEMEWMVKGRVNCPFFSNDADLLMMMLFFFQGRVNSVLFNALWTCAPILISIISFFTYVMLGNQLTVGVAFTVRLL